MKAISTILLLLVSLSSQAKTLRAECEDAYYATGYVKLHQYTVVVKWALISDHAHSRLEEILFDNFKILSVKELEDKSIYQIKENVNVDATSYELLLEELKKIPTTVTCTYDI